MRKSPSILFCVLEPFLPIKGGYGFRINTLIKRFDEYHKIFIVPKNQSEDSILGTYFNCCVFRTRTPIPRFPRFSYMERAKFLAVLPFAVEAAFKMKKAMGKYNVKVIYGFGSTVPISMYMTGGNCTPLILDLCEDNIPRARTLNHSIIFRSYGALAEEILLSYLERTQGEVIVLTNVMKNFVKTIMHSKNISVAYDGTDPDLFKVINPEFKRDPLIVFTGDINVRDGVHILIKAFAHVVKELPTAKLYIIGDGPLLPKLNKLAIKIGLNRNVVFTGWIPFSRLVEILPSFSIGAVPSTPCLINSLVIPRKTFEFMAAGLPVVASNLKAMREIVDDGVSGVLYEAGDEEALSEGILKLLTDEKIYIRMQENGRKVAQKHSVHVEVSKIERLMRAYLD